eukprot:366048-Chlamydomonas_euryale.AAC.14
MPGGGGSSWCCSASQLMPDSHGCALSSPSPGRTRAPSRSPGSRRSSALTKSAACGDADGGSARAGAHFATRRYTCISSSPGAANGVSPPVSSANVSTPSAHRSAVVPAPCPSTVSGARYSG